jgi:hypothetical protein
MKMIAGVILAVALVLSSCKKPEKGPKGDTGAPGSNGNNGVTNIVSFSLQATPSSWVHIGTSGQSGDAYMATFSVPALTSTMLTTGAVIMYIQTGTTITQMPIALTIYQNVTSSFYFDATTGLVRVYTADSDFYTLQPSINWDFRLVIIPSGRIKKNVDISNYNDFMTIYNIKN